MVEHKTRLSSSEIGALWETYYQGTIAMCLIKYFLHHMEDEDIRQILLTAKNTFDNHLNQIVTIFNAEDIPIPDGFSDKDINLSAPPLFYDPFGLSFVYTLGRMNMINYSFITCNIARSDVLMFFQKALQDSTELYKNSTALLKEKGLYDRPPMIPYPKKVEYIQKTSYISGLFGEKRPLNVMELTEIFFNIERNYFSVILCMGLAQTVDDKVIREFILAGKEISERQIVFFNGVLMKEELLGTVPVNNEVTDSTVSPFSNKLIMALFTFLNSIDVALIGHALSLFMRTDLSTNSMKFINEILVYMGKGFNIMVDRGWLEEPPHAVNRKEMMNPDKN